MIEIKAVALELNKANFDGVYISSELIARAIVLDSSLHSFVGMFFEGYRLVDFRDIIVNWTSVTIIDNQLILEGKSVNEDLKRFLLSGLELYIVVNAEYSIDGNDVLKDIKIRSFDVFYEFYQAQNRNCRIFEFSIKS